MCNKEIVICAAIWVQDGKKRPHQPINIPSGAVFCGLRHCSIISQFAAYGIAHKKPQCSRIFDKQEPVSNKRGGI